MRVLLETDSAMVGFDEQKKAIVVLWSGDPSEKEFNQVYNSVIKAFKIYFVNLLVNDFAKLSILTPFQMDLLTEHVFPMTYKCGMRNLFNVSLNSGVVEGITEQIESQFNSSGKKIRVQTSTSFNEVIEKIPI